MIIDIHTHVGIMKSWSPYLIGHVRATVLDLISYMDRVGVDIAVLLPLPGRIEPDTIIPGTEKVIRLSKEYPDRIIPFCVVDPRGIKVEEKVERYVKMGCRGLGEYKVPLPIDDRRSVSIFKLCADLGIPILVHMDNRFNPDIHRFISVLNEVPDAVFIMHGPGWWKHISANVDEKTDYPKGKVTPGGLVEKIFREYKNVYADISAYSGLNALRRDPAYSKSFISKFSNRLLYGTDFPGISPEGNQFGPNKAHLNLIMNLGLDTNIVDNVLYKNALRILDIHV